MIRAREISTACALVSNIQEEHPFLGVVLELLEVLRFLGRAALNFEELDFILREGLGDLLHEVGELNEYEDALILWNAFPRSK